MKKRLLFLAICSSVILSACGAASSAEKDDVISKIDKEYKAEKTYSFKVENFELLNVNYSYKVTAANYELALLDDINARVVLNITYEYGTVEETKIYRGQYAKEENRIIFSFDQEAYKIAFYFDENDNVKTVRRVEPYDIVDDISGTYNCQDDKYGNMTLYIDDQNYAELTIEDGTLYTGSVSLYDNRYDLMVYTEEDSIDWYVDLSNGEFSYEVFGYNPVYEALAGDYTIYGDFGDVNLQVDTFGNASATFVVNGEDIFVNGSIYYDEYTELLSGAYLYNDEGYVFDLTIVNIGDNVLNYSGTILKPLSAG